VSFIGNGPLHILAFGEIDRLSDGRREVDVPLLTFFAFDELNFCWESHMAISSHITRHIGNNKMQIQAVYLVGAKLLRSPLTTTKVKGRGPGDHATLRL